MYMWLKCLLTDQDKMSNHYRGPSIYDFPPSFGSFGQAVSEDKIFRNWATRNKNRLWRPCLLTNQNEMRNFNIEPSINASYQVSVHLAKQIQRRRIKCEKLSDDICQVMAKAHMDFRRGELKRTKGQTMMYKKLHRKLEIE